MEYSDGVRPYILEWYYNVFLKAFEEKNGPDSKINSKGDELKEDRIALTSQDLIKKHFEIHNETLTTKRLLESYLYPLLNQGYIDKIDSIIDRRAKIYYPVITTKKYINLFENEQSNNLLQQKEKIVVKSTIFPSKEHIISKIEPILKYYSENGFIVNIKNHKNEEITIDDFVSQYFDNTEDYFGIDEEEDITGGNNDDNKDEEVKEEKENFISNNSDANDNHNTTSNTNNSNSDDILDTKDSSDRIPVNLDIEKNNLSKDGTSEEYLQNGQNLQQLHENSKNDVNITKNIIKESNKLFEIAKTNKIIYSESREDNNSNYKLLINESLICCHYCNFTSNSESELVTHSVNSHPGLPARPDPNLLELMKKGNKDEK
jgi:hypothetical protein